MLINLGALLTLLPAFVIVLVGMSITSRVVDQGRARSWMQFLLSAAVLLSLPIAVFGSSLSTGVMGLYILILLPALVSVLTLLLLDWHSLIDLWRAQKRLASVLLALLALLLGLMGLKAPQFTLLLLVLVLLIAASWQAMRRLGISSLSILGWLVLGLLLLEISGLAGSPEVLNTNILRLAYEIGLVIVPFLALVIAALLARQSLDSASWLQRLPRLILPVLLLLALAGGVFRGAVLVKATGRAFEDYAPLIILASAVIVGLLVTLTGGKRIVPAGLAFTFLVPSLIVSSYTLGWRLDPHAITTERARRIDKAIMQYHQEHGIYPPDLPALTPRYLPILLGPLNGRGQEWCYQSGKDFYRLGYVIFQRYYDWGDGTPFFEPYYKIKILHSTGEPPAGAWMCDQQLQYMHAIGGL